MDLLAPLASGRGGPLVYPALGLSLVVEPFTPDDAEAWTAAIEQIRDALGPTLRWSFLQSLGFPEKYSPSGLSYLARLPLVLGHDATVGVPPALQTIARRTYALTHGEFAYAAHAGAESYHGSPLSLRVYCEVLDDKSYKIGTMLRVTFPANHPLDTFTTLCDSLAAGLRIRWASAGYTYAGWDIQFPAEVRSAMFKHSRRYHCFDVPVHATLMHEWHAKLRSVNWLTYVGPAFAAKLALDSCQVDHATLPNGVVRLQLGPAPDVGDVNRFGLPPIWNAADACVSPVRSTGEGINFLEPWDARTTREWLTRLTRRSRRTP